jgi:hypothetical protein
MRGWFRAHKNQCGSRGFEPPTEHDCPKAIERRAVDGVRRPLSVRLRGFEPPRPFGHKLLRLARLPVPPQPRVARLAATYFIERRRGAEGGGWKGGSWRSCCATNDLVSGYRGIDFLRPLVDAASHALGLWIALLAQPLSDSKAAATDMAQHNNGTLAVRLEFA